MTAHRPSFGDSAEHVVAQLGLQPLPGEGGFWRPGPRTAGLSSIVFLLTDAPDGFSALHLLQVDEGWQWLAGAPAALVLERDTRLATVRLGPNAQLQEVVPASTWQAARTEGTWTLVSCWCAPAFTDERFRLGSRADLERRFPGDVAVVRRHTRDD